MNGSYRTGLVLLGLLSVEDLSAPLLTDGEHPPMVIALAGALLGLVSLALLWASWPGRVAAALGLVVLRLLSALTAVPAFFEPGVPGAAKLLAGIAIALTLIGATLVLSGLRRPALVGAR